MESSLRSDISRIYGRIGNDFMNQNETQWDKLLKIKTTGRDDSRSDQYRYPYEERDEYVFICLIRRDADLLVLSMMSEFLRVPKQTENMLYQAGRFRLN